MREITSIAVDITTHCDRRCPDCCCGIGINRKLQHHSWEYFEALAPFIYGIDRVSLMGGEPTLHPRFAEFVPQFRRLFGCKRLVLATDGFRAERYKDLIEAAFDEVHFSDYHTRVIPALSGVDVLIFPAGKDAVNFVPRSRRGGGNVCERGRSEHAAFADGKFFACCVSPGLDGVQGLAPCLDWRERIQQLDMGCKECFFSV